MPTLRTKHCKANIILTLPLGTLKIRHHDNYTSEDFLISLSAGKWSIPTTTGPRPPPCTAFSFTAVSDHLAVLFGGKQPDGRVSDCYTMNFKTMVCPQVFCDNSSMEVCATHATLEMSAHSVGGAELSGDTVNTMNNIQFTTAIYKP